MTIDRTLVRIERDGEWTIVEQDGIDPLFDPVVILGAPGMGRTTLLRGLCRRTGMAGDRHMEPVALRLADMGDAASARLLCEAVAREAMDAASTPALPFAPAP